MDAKLCHVHGFRVRNQIKAMDDTGAVMTPFGDVVAVILVVNSYVVGHVD